MQEELLIVGDFNIHVDSSNNESQSFLDILNANGLIQHVKSSTHQKGHILDLVITREHSNLLKRPPVVFISGVSDVKSSSSLDSDILKNYRPVSNLTFISKVIENVVSGRLNEHLIKNSMFDPLQSAYRDKHSTETALIKV